LSTVLARLTRQIDAGRLARDPAQLECARKLDALAAALAAPRAGGLLSLLRLPWSSAEDVEPVRGLYIWGSVGRGKTFLMDLFFESLGQEERRRSHFYRFMRDVHAELATLKGVENPLEQVADRIARQARVLCFDEFFVSDIGDAMILGTLFAALFRRGVTLVATSNVPPEQLYKDGLQRQRFLPAIELLQHHTEAVKLDGGVDYRLRHLEQSGTYLDSSSLQSADTLARLFTDLNGGPAGNAGKLNIEGREVPVRQVAPDMVWFDFSDICEGARSQNDYIDLAHDYHTVFVSNVPVFDVTREDAARRFIMLVDEFYDRGVKLVLSAAAAPQELYQGERLKFEFERTTSRLIEMQSAQYLAQQHRA
jgi:cell division protein ZapE